MIRFSIFLTAVLLLVPSASLAADAPRAGRPDVLVIMCDQLNASVLSCYGGPVATPHIDRIAQRGVRFNQAICTTPFCSPSRASLITGLYPHSHGIVYNVNRRDYPAIPSPPNQEGIKAADVTTEKLLGAAGYATHHYGKWHLGDEDLPYYADMFGEHREYEAEMGETFAAVRTLDRAAWMEWYGWAVPTTRSAAFQEAVNRASELWTKSPFRDFVSKMGRLELPLARNFDVRVGDKTVERIAAAKGRPFMITCSFNAPHDPNVVPSPYYERFDPAAIKLPANSGAPEKRFQKDWARRIVVDLGEPGLREFLRIYYASVMLIDDQVGRILMALDESGQSDNTVIVFTSDHGDMMGGHGMVWKSTEAFYDEIVRIPLLISYPARLKPQRCELAVDLTDIMPTLLDLTGQPVAKQVQGEDLVPYLTGGADPQSARGYSFCERMGGNRQNVRQVCPGTKGAFMVRGQGWKYIRYPDGDEYLYHLADDPGEQKNLAKDTACEARKREMANALKGWLQRTGCP